MSATSIISNDARYTAQAQASDPTKKTGAAQKLGSQDFLNLMMKQLQYQDPMEPTGNTEFIAQQAQFSQLDATNSMNTNIASSNAVALSQSLIGKNVTIVDPDDAKKTITGNVSAATINGSNSGFVLNGKTYSLGSLKTINGMASSQTTETPSS